MKPWNARCGLALLSLWLGACKGGSGGPTAVQAQGAFAPAFLTFAALPVGDVETATVTLADLATVDLATLGAPVINGDFALLTPVPTSLTAQSSVPLQIQFTPTATGMRQGTLTIPTPGAASASVTLSLMGQGEDPNGVTLQVSPHALNFGTLLLGETSTEQVQLFNPNSFDVGAIVTLVDANVRPQFAAASAGFSPLADGGRFSALVAPQQAVTIGLTFAPSLAQASSASLQVAACPSCQQSSVALTGTGIDAHLVFDPPHLDFGYVQNAVYPPPSRPVTARNLGNLPLTLISLDVPVNSPFLLLNPPPANTPLPADGGSAAFSISYSPSGALSDRLQVAATWSVLPPGASTPVTRVSYLPVYGNQSLGGCRLEVAQDAGLNFGSLSPGVSLTEDIELDNAGGDACTVQVNLDPTSSAAFSLGAPAQGGGSFDAGWLVAAHGSTVFPVTFVTAPDTHHLTYGGGVVIGVLDGGPLERVPLTAALASGYAIGSSWPKWGHDNGNSGQGDLDTSKTTGTLLWRVLPPLIPAETPGYEVFDAGFGALELYTPTPNVAGRYYPTVYPASSYQVGANYVGPVLTAEGDIVQLVNPYWQTLYAFSPADGGISAWIPIGNGQFNMPNAAIEGVPSPVVAQNGLVALDLTYSWISSNNNLGANSGPLAYVSLSLGQAVTFTGSNFGITTYAPPLLVPNTVEFLGATNQSTGDCWFSEPLQTTQPMAPPPCLKNQLIPTGGLPSAALDADNNAYYCGQGALEVNYANPGVANGCAQFRGTDARIGWQISWPSGNVGAPVLAFGQLFVNTFEELAVQVSGEEPSHVYQSTIYSLDPATGNVNWQYQLPSVPVPATGRAPNLDAGIPGLDFKPDYFANAWFHLAVGDDGALIVAYVDGVYCLEASGPNQGTLRWRLPVAGGSLGTASLGLDGTAYIGSIAQGLLAIDARTGTLRWNYPLPPSTPPALDVYGNTVRSVTARPALGDQVIYFVGDDDYVYAVH